MHPVNNACRRQLTNAIDERQATLEQHRLARLGSAEDSGADGGEGLLEADDDHVVVRQSSFRTPGAVLPTRTAPGPCAALTRPHVQPCLTGSKSGEGPSGQT